MTRSNLIQFIYYLDATLHGAHHTVSLDGGRGRVELVDVLDPGQMAVHHGAGLDSDQPVAQHRPLGDGEVHPLVTHHGRAGKLLHQRLVFVELLLRAERAVSFRFPTHGQHNEFVPDGDRDDTLHWAGLTVGCEQFVALEDSPFLSRHAVL